MGRNLEVTRIEGLAGSVACAGVLPAAASLPPGSRRVTMSWHPEWRLATKVAEPGRITTSIYNGQPDPFNGNTPAACAPATALLPDGRKIGVLCKQVQQATTDADGRQGFGAALQAGVPDRVQRWTYDQNGQVLSATDALNRTTTYTYYADTSFSGADPTAVGHTMGDLKTVTNPLLQTTEYRLYNKIGQLLESVDANGVVTSQAYDLRHRLVRSSTAGQTTGYEYWPTGLLKTVTLPDATTLGYEYDQAHRLTAVKDNLGNRIEYTLDNAGNRVAETLKDVRGELSRRLTRSVDALGRVQLATGGR